MPVAFSFVCSCAIGFCALYLVSARNANENPRRRRTKKKTQTPTTKRTGNQLNGLGQLIDVNIALLKVLRVRAPYALLDCDRSHESPSRLVT